MSASQSPIFIIVGALMSVLAIGIVLNITTGFFMDQAEHSDEQQFSEFIIEIEDKCEQLDEVEEIHFSSSIEIELRNSDIELDDEEKEATLNPEDDKREIECNADIESEFTIIESGTSEIILDEESGTIEVSKS